MAYTITKLERDAAEGFWKARINGVPVHRRYGSWWTDSLPPRGVMPEAAAKLQAKVSPIERAEGRRVEVKR